jgi:hypothetical protein
MVPGRRWWPDTGTGGPSGRLMQDKFVFGLELGAAVVRNEKMVTCLGRFRKLRRRGTSAVESHYQATANED